MRGYLTALMILFAFASVLTSPQSAQAPAPRPELLSETDLSLLSDGWMALAKGDIALASRRAADLRSRDPRSGQALLFGIEVDLSRAGALAALQGYESWLSGRTLDDPIALRRIARALLFEIARASDPSARVEALSALAAAGEPDAATALATAAGTGALAETRALAAAGNASAISRLSQELAGPIGNKLAIIESLVQSGKPQVIQPLTSLLQDPRPEHRAAAADGLGRLGARNQIPALRAMLANPGSSHQEQIAAAGALLRLDDDTGYAALVGRLRSDIPGIRVAAARSLEVRKDLSWLAVVRQLALDPDPGVRLDALRLLAPYDREATAASLERLMSDQSLGVREQAIRIYAQQVAGDFATLRGLFRSTDAVVRAIACRRVLELTR